MAVGTVLFLPGAQQWAILQTVHRCLEQVLMCPLMMPQMRTAVKACILYIHQFNIEAAVPNVAMCQWYAIIYKLQ